MIVYHKLENRTIDISDAFSNHSADQTIAYKTAAGKPVYLGYYFPKKYVGNDKLPLFIFIHGGGWSSHKIFEDQPHWQGDYLGYLARYYANRGFVSVSIDYRLCGDLGQPGIIDCYEDCCDAMDYIIAHADEYGVDVQNMYLLGESAGGHLAGALAAFHYDRRYFLKKVFLVNPITHFYDEWKTMVPVHSSHPKLAGLSFAERAAFLSPLCQIQEDICEIVLIHGESDTAVSPDHSQKFYDRMMELSKRCELHIIEKTGHAFLLAEYTNQGMNACLLSIEIINRAIDFEMGEKDVYVS